MNNLVLQQKRLPSPDSFLKGRWKVTASIDSHQEAMKRGRIRGRGQATNIYQFLLKESPAKKTIFSKSLKLWEIGTPNFLAEHETVPLWRKEYAGLTRVRFGKNSSKAPTP